MGIIDKLNKFIAKNIVMAEPDDRWFEDDNWYEEHTDDKMMSSKKRKNKKSYKTKLKEQGKEYGDTSGKCFDERCGR